MLPLRKIHKCTSTSPDGNAYYQIDPVFINRRRQSSVFDVRSYRGTNCDTGNYYIVSEITEGLSLSKRAAQKFDMQRFVLKKPKDVQFKEKCETKIWNRYATLENLDNNVDSISAVQLGGKHYTTFSLNSI
jgi:hypothetical protein